MIPVKLKCDDFSYLGRDYDKGEIFEAPHEAFASFLCEQEKKATRVKVDKDGSYNTKVMTPKVESESSKPVLTKTEKPAEVKPVEAKQGASSKKKAKSNVKVKSDAVSENS